MDDGVPVISQSTRKRGTLLLGSGTLAAMLVFAPGATAWAAPPPTAGLDYVALGDSYAAGLGLLDPTGIIPGCGQSTSSYPQQLAAQLGLTLTDVTCSGASTANVISTSQDTGFGINPVQAEALSADTDIVTLTIGGNDLGFSSIIQACIAGTSDGPLVFYPAPAPDNCKAVFNAGGFDSLAAMVAGPVSASLAATLTAINAAAPNAKVFVVGYPSLMPGETNIPDGGCFSAFDGSTPAFPFTTTDIGYLRGIQSQLDAAMSAAAVAGSATFVPMLSSTLAHSPCAGNQAAYVNGASAAPGAMHPNADGAEFMTDTARDAIESALTAPVITPASTGFSVPVGVAVSLGFTATGFPNPTLSVSGVLPAGMTFDPTTGVLSGTPSTAGTSSFSITATNSVSTVTEQYTIKVTTPATGGPGALPVQALAATGSDSLISMGIAGSIVLLSGAGLLFTRRFAKR